MLPLPSIFGLTSLSKNSFSEGPCFEHFLGQMLLLLWCFVASPA
jgi:hypothetical protein